MNRPRIEDVDYYDFIRMLRQANDNRCIIEKTDKDKWAEYVAENGIRDVSLEAHAKVKFASGKPSLVAITMGSAWDGCYAYSKADEAAIKYVK